MARAEGRVNGAERLTALASRANAPEGRAMQAPYAEAAPDAAPRERGLRLARILTVLYFCACSLQGLIRLRTAGATPEAFAAVLHAWYAEALIFGALWGLAALIHGMVQGGGGERAPRRTPDTAPNGMLRALERDRGR